MNHSADLILRGLRAGVAGNLGATFASGVVITSEARNLLLFAHGTTAGEKQQIPHGLKAVHDDNSETGNTPLLMQHWIKPLLLMNSLDSALKVRTGRISWE